MYLQANCDVRYTVLDTTAGPLEIAANDDGLVRVAFTDGDGAPPRPAAWRRDDRFLAAARAQLDQYFHGVRTTFTLPRAPCGTPFQRRVWDVLCEIPYGATTSYGALARRLGDAKATRAVGAANGRNPLAVVVPCHRVIGADGTLTGYAGGLHLKQLLLELERSAAAPLRTSAGEHQGSTLGGDA